MWTPAPEAKWRTSSRSGGQGQCVEIVVSDQGAAVRDSKSRDVMLTFSRTAWATFLYQETKRG